MNPQWGQQQRQQFQAPQQYPQPTGLQPQPSFGLSLASQPTGFQPNAFQRPPPVPPTPPSPSSFQQVQPTGFAGGAFGGGFPPTNFQPLATKPTGFGVLQMSQTFMPANPSMPYGPGSTPQFAVPPQQAQGPSLQQSMQQHNHNVLGGPKISWALSKDERQSYDNLFRAWDTQGTGFISGKTAKEIFGQSGLSQQDLEKIWYLADSTNRGSLNLPEFRVAMSLIYRGLNGAPIPTVLPPELDPSSERDLGDSYNQNAGGGPIIPWALSKDESKRYDDIFRAWDTQGTGLISGKTAKEIFGQSGLSQQDLEKIWYLADSTNRGSLNLPEFRIAMGLIYRGLNGAPIPTVLPPELVPPPERDLKDSVNFLKDILLKDSHGRASNGSSPNPQHGKIRSLHGTRAGDPLHGGRKDGAGYVQDDSDTRTREDDELGDELNDLKYRVKRVQEDLDRTNRGPRSVRKDEERRRLERELLQLLHEKIPEVERKLEERESEKRGDRDRRDRRNVDSSGYGRDRSARYDTPAPPPRSSSAVGGSTRSPLPSSSTLSTASAQAIPPSLAKMTPAEKAAFFKAEAQRRTEERLRALGIGTKSQPARTWSPPPG